MRRLALLAWAGVAVCVLFSIGFWRLGWNGPVWLRPHTVWAVLGLLTAFVPLFVTAWFAGMRLWRRKGRVAGLGWLLAAATPLVWCACYFGHLWVVAESRDSIRMGAPAKTAVAGALAYLDLEARLRYPQITPGTHVRLFHHGDVADPQRLTLLMDRHLEEMAGLLGERVPAGRVSWVRGPLLGTTGRAIVTWGICSLDDSDGELTYLDRHEMAHVLITVLGGPDQEPPHVLVEGWAQYWSTERNKEVVALARLHARDEVYPLQELVTPAWYGRSAGPAYSHGGPLAYYLIERFGGERFFEIYAGVRQATFAADYQRIAGETWKETEERFWTWVNVEAGLAARDAEEVDEDEAEGATPPIELADGVDPAAWQELLEGVRENHPEKVELPRDVAYEIRSETQSESDPDDVEHLAVRLVTRGEEFWATEYRGDWATFLSVAAGQSVSLMDHDGRRVGEVNSVAARRNARAHARWFAEDISGRPSIPWRESEPGGRAWRIERVERPKSDGDRWIVEAAVRDSGADPDDEEDLTIQRSEIDPAVGWCEVRFFAEQPGRWTSRWERECEPRGDRYMAVRTTIRLERFPVEGDEDVAGVYLTDTTVTPLSEAGVEAVRDDIAAAGRRGPTPKYLAARRLIRTAAWGTPITAVGLLLVAAAGRTTRYSD